MAIHQPLDPFQIFEQVISLQKSASFNRRCDKRKCSFGPMSLDNLNFCKDLNTFSSLLVLKLQRQKRQLQAEPTVHAYN